MAVTVDTTSAWPWMLDEEEEAEEEEQVKISGMHHVHKNQSQIVDNRPRVKELIQEHHDKIESIRLALAEHPLYEPSKHDDLWLLRFWLAQMNQHLTNRRAIAAAIQGAKRAIEFRKELGLDQWDIRHYSPTDCVEGTMVHDFLQYWDTSSKDACVFVPPSDGEGGSSPMCFFQLQQQPRRSSSKTVVQELTEDYWFAMMGHCAEWLFQWADYITRKTGRLTMATCTMDATGLTSLMGENNRWSCKIFGVLEKFYPHTVEVINVCNAPLVLRSMLKFWGPTTQTRINIVNTPIDDVLVWGTQKPFGNDSLSTLLTELSEELYDGTFAL